MANNPQFTGLQPLRPRIIGGHVGLPPSPLPPISVQFRPAHPPPLAPQPFVPVTPQQFQPVGHPNMAILPTHPMPIQYPPGAPPPPPVLPPQRPNLLVHGLPQGPPLQPADFQTNRPVIPEPTQPQIASNFMSNFSGPIISPASYNLSSSAGGHHQMSVGPTSQHQSMTQSIIPNFPGGKAWLLHGTQNLQPVISHHEVEKSVAVQPWLSIGNPNLNSAVPLNQLRERSSAVPQWFPTANQKLQSGTPSQQIEEKKPLKPESIVKASDWKEHTSSDGKKYYHNKRTKISSWDKPLELMTLMERADASTDWREFTSLDDRKYFFNKVTKQSKWAIPDEVKLAREWANMLSFEGTANIEDFDAHASAPDSVSGRQASISPADKSAQEKMSSSDAGGPAVNAESTVEPEFAATCEPLSKQEEFTTLALDASGLHDPIETTISIVVSNEAVPIDMGSSMTPPMNTSKSSVSPQKAAVLSVNETSCGMEEANKIAVNSGSGSIGTLEGKQVEHGSSAYERKEEAKNVFRVLLEAANVGSDWTWDEAMRVIINDRRYSALRTLGERKQTFHEFVGRKKKLEAEERRSKQKKSREDFKKMLNEFKDLTSSMRWSKAVSMFESDERFQAVERAKDREDLFVDYLEEIKKKERAKVLEERKRQKTCYLEFLKSCDFIKASSQWRKVQHRVEADERCSCLDKIERLEIFQEYIRDLELEEEEERKLRMEESRKVERKNRDEFRKLMDEHVAIGILSASTQWRDYLMKVKDAPAYLAVSSNTSGYSTKELFQDVIDDLGKQYLEDKEKIEDAIKNEKIFLSTNCTLEDFKVTLPRAIFVTSISDINIQLIYNELMEKSKEKEEKEAKKRKRLAREFYDFLCSLKEITASSKWEDCKPLAEERFIGEEGFFRETFDNFIMDLKENVKEERRRKDVKVKKERKREGKDRKNTHRRVESKKGNERRKKDDSDSDESKSLSFEENRRSSRDRTKKYRKRHMDSFDDSSLDDDDDVNDQKDRSKSRKRGSYTKKSKQVDHKQSWTSEVDSETENKKHERHNFHNSNKDADMEDEDPREDGEVR